jgi:SAM-dependent MidA family methyltransferase
MRTNSISRFSNERDEQNQRSTIHSNELVDAFTERTVAQSKKVLHPIVYALSKFRCDYKAALYAKKNRICGITTILSALQPPLN